LVWCMVSHDIDVVICAETCVFNTAGSIWTRFDTSVVTAVQCRFVTLSNHSRMCPHC